MPRMDLLIYYLCYLFVFCMYPESPKDCKLLLVCMMC